MTAPLFITTEKKTSALPILLVDKPGQLSKGLVSLLSEHFTTIVVSEKLHLPHLTHVTHVPYRRSIPQIPDDYFSAIILFYAGEKGIADGMKSFVKKAKQNNTKLIVVTSRELAKSPFLEKTLKEYDHTHLIVYGEIFGVSTHEDSPVTRMLSEAIHRGKISVHGAGLAESYPVYYADVLQGILHVLLSHRPQAVGLAFPSHPIPEIHLARLVQRLYPDAELVFVGKEKPKEKPLYLGGSQLIEDPYPLGEKLAHLKRTPVALTTSYPQKVRRSRFRRRFLPLTLLACGVVCMVLFLTVIFFLFGALSLHVTVQAAKRNNYPLVLERSQTAWNLFALAENSMAPLRVVGRGIGLGEVVDTYEDSVNAGKTAAGIAAYMADAGMTYQKIAKKQTTGSEDMVRVAADIKHALLGIQRLRSGDLLPDVYKKEVASYAEPLEKLSGVIEHLPYLTGSHKEQVYLVLFQNNMELRPGGGFIGSYGLLRMKNGAMTAFTIHDVYDADGQLTGHVEPPFGLRRHLGASHWFLRDSNYDVEFSQNAALAASLLKLSTDEQVDGVIAMDVSFLKTLLEKTGPVYVPAFNKTVSEKNFYLLTQEQAESDFFPGSSQKKDFLEHVAKALVLSLEERDQLPLQELLLAASDAVNQKHLQFAHSNSSYMATLVANGFAPSVLKNQAEKQATIADVMGVVDANVGANKANFYIKRSLGQQVTVKESGEREGTVTVTYQNTSMKGSPFGGEYKNYVRLMLPEDASVIRIEVDGEEQEIIDAVTNPRVFTSERFVAPTELELEKEIKYGRAFYGFLVVVPQLKTTTVKLSYVIKAPMSFPDNFTYVQRVYKQPGTDYDPYRLSVTVDPTIIITNPSPFAGRVGNTLQVVRDLSEDITLSFTGVIQ